jgi:DMSO/TMAO reductase YedYZ heme-binding membrane subunit
MCCLAYGTQAEPVEGMRLVLRLTARAALVIFGLAFTASAARRLWPTAFTRWQSANRRYLGLAFAAVHFMHLAGIVMLIRMVPDFFARQSPWPLLIGGGAPYVLLTLMVVTSFKPTAAWLGPKWWRWLHLTGSYALLIVFMMTFGSSVVKGPAYWPFAAYVIAILVVRIVGRQKAPDAAIVTT